MQFGGFGSDDNTMDLLGMEVQKNMYKDMDFDGETPKESNREYAASRKKKKESSTKAIIAAVVMFIVFCIGAIWLFVL